MFRSNHGFIRSLHLDGEGDGSGNGAPSTPTIRIQHGGQTIEVPRPDGLLSQAEIEEKYVLKASHNDMMARSRKELDARKGLKPADEYLSDADFKTKAMATWGLLDPKATNEEYKNQLARAQNELKEREVLPLQSKLATYEKTVAGLREKDRRGQILQAAAAAGVEEKFLKAPTRNGKPLVVSMLEDAFAYDAESDDWFAKGNGASPYAFSQSGDTPYMTIGEFLSTWVKGDGRDFAKSTRQGGAESSPAGAGAGAGTPGRVGQELRITQEQMRDIPTFKRLQEKAQKEGLTLVPVS